jgi:hypothetical protein
MIDDRQPSQVRWAVIVSFGRIVVEAETAEEAREKVDGKVTSFLEVNKDASDQPVSF